MMRGYRKTSSNSYTIVCDNTSRCPPRKIRNRIRRLSPNPSLCPPTRTLVSRVILNGRACSLDGPAAWPQTTPPLPAPAKRGGAAGRSRRNTLPTDLRPPAQPPRRPLPCVIRKGRMLNDSSSVRLRPMRFSTTPRVSTGKSRTLCNISHLRGSIRLKHTPNPQTCQTTLESVLLR